MVTGPNTDLLDRRQILALATAAVTALSASPALGAPLRLVFVHGRSQQGRDPVELKAEWIAALTEGAAALGKELPAGLNVVLPFYGDKLDEFARAFDIPLTSEVRTRGSDIEDEFLVFQAEVAEEMRQKAGVSDAEVDAEYGSNPKPKGPLNWEWVQAILRALDKHAGGMSQFTLESFTRDVFLYTNRAGVRDVINEIVAAAITDQPTVVVGHSLGSVVAYSVLVTDPRPLKVPLFMTVGSPLGVRPVRNQFRPLKFPKGVSAWYNAYDNRDVVALYALDAANFPVTPAIENFSSVDNHTDNRHGIAGYLDDRTIAEKLLGALGS